ncbi:MAG: hypothetical protein HYT79_06650 [Elusimicrobia bacterium]|nr:hypothetical protein [Elusimicrobiota bacterium]
MDHYAVLLTDARHFQPPAIAKAIAAFKGIPLYDAARLAKKCRGIVGEDLEEEPAKKLAQELKTTGLEGLIVPMASLAQLPVAEPIAQIDPDSKGWRFLLKTGQFATADSTALSLITAVGCEEITAKTTEVKQGPTVAQRAMSIGLMMTTGLPINIGGKNPMVKKTEHQTKQLYFADIFLKDPPRRLRLDAQDLNYAYLKERKAYNVFNNFKALLNDLIKSAPGAKLNLGATSIIQAKPLYDLGYESLADGERESRWLLTL